MGEEETGFSGAALPCAWHHVFPGDLLGSGKPVLIGFQCPASRCWERPRGLNGASSRRSAQAVRATAGSTSLQSPAACWECTLPSWHSPCDSTGPNTGTPCNFFSLLRALQSPLLLSLEAKARCSKGGCVSSSCAHAQTFVKTPCDVSACKSCGQYKITWHAVLSTAPLSCAPL